MSKQHTAPKIAGNTNLAGIIALLGFVLVATASTTNMILARGLSGSVPPVTLAFVRWWPARSGSSRAAASTR